MTTITLTCDYCKNSFQGRNDRFGRTSKKRFCCIDHKRAFYSSEEYILERLLQNIKKNERGCWEWQGYCQEGGYGTISLSGHRVVLTHRLSHQLLKGQVPDELLVLHHCDNPPCINPDHLFLGTHKTNHDDAKQKRRHTHGEKHGMAILCESQILPIRGDSRPTLIIAQEYGVHPQTIRQIKKYKLWKHVV